MLFSLKLLFHLFHTLLVFDVDVLLNFNDHRLAVSTNLGHTVQFATRHFGKLFSESCDLVVEFTDHGVLRVFVDSGLVLDVLGARCVAKSRHGFINVVISGANICDHHRLCVAAQ